MKDAAANAVCRHCGAALDALARVRGLDYCDAAPCRQKADHERTAGFKEALSNAALAAAHSQLQLQQLSSAVVWLQHCESRTIPVDDDDRERHRATLNRSSLTALSTINRMSRYRLRTSGTRRGNDYVRNAVAAAARTVRLRVPLST